MIRIKSSLKNINTIEYIVIRTAKIDNSISKTLETIVNRRLLLLTSMPTIIIVAKIIATTHDFHDP